MCIDAALNPSWLRNLHLKDPSINAAYSDAIRAKEGFQYRGKCNPVTADLWNRYVDAMCKLQRLVKSFNQRSRRYGVANRKGC